MSSSKQVLAGLIAAALAVASSGALAKDHRYDDRYAGPYGEGVYDYAKVIDVQPLTTRVRVTTPQRALRTCPESGSAGSLWPGSGVSRLRVRIRQ